MDLRQIILDVDVTQKIRLSCCQTCSINLSRPFHPIPRPPISRVGHVFGVVLTITMTGGDAVDPVLVNSSTFGVASWR